MKKKKSKKKLTRKKAKKKYSSKKDPFAEIKKEYKKLIKPIEKFFFSIATETQPAKNKYRILKKIKKKKKIVKKTKGKTKNKRRK